MKLDKKKNLAKRVLNVGKERIIFVKERLSEIKEAITKQDIKDLKQDGAILIKGIKGRSKVNKKRRRNPGKIKKKVNTRKRDYIIITRKLRTYLKNIKARGEISQENFREIRKKIRNRQYGSLKSLKEHIKSDLGGRK